MIEQQKFEQINVFLNQEDHQNVIELLKNFIEETPAELIYYWYLGLAYLLQENENLAQEVWLSVFLQGSLEEVEQWTTELISFLEIKVQENIIQKKLGNAKVIYEAIFIIDADYENTELLDSLVEALSLFASDLSFNKDYEAALEVYLETLNLNPAHSISWHSLSLTYYNLEDYVKAEESIQRAIRLDSRSAENYHVLGLILEKIENNDSAIKAYQKAIEQDAKFTHAYDKLGDIYLQKNEVDKAIETYQIVLDLTPYPSKAPIFNKIATAYEIAENKPLASLNLGYYAYLINNNKEAILNFEEFLASEIGDVRIYTTIAHCYMSLDQPLSAITLIKKSLNLFPSNLSLIRLNQAVLPLIYKDTEEIRAYRNRFSYFLIQLIENTNLTTKEEQYEAFKSAQLVTNFFLGYQGKNDLEIQKQYANYVHLIMNKIYPQWCQSISIEQPYYQRKIRIGYVSCRLHNLGILYLGWLKYLDNSKFETYVYDVSGNDKNIKNERLKFRDEFKIYSNHMQFITGEIDEIASSIVADHLDILIFPEIGLDSKINLLSCLRLAPIQCTTWAHPITSGSPTIDYFLSSELMEPENGEKHYSEKLVRLPNIGFCIEPPNLSVSDKQRSDFQFRGDSIVYLSCQSLFKYLPQHDYIFPSIAQQNKFAQFVFLDSYLGSPITDNFKKRIDKAFAKFNLNYEDYCSFLRQVPPPEYLRLNQLADVFLDSFGWSGGITTTEAIACSLPVVSCPGEMMRARHSYGILRMLGLTETIAQTEAEYIEIAVRLGLDQEWRQFIRDKITANKHRIFNDQECISALEIFFQQAVENHSNNVST